ncbi:hypothetical protein M5F00_01795 [Acinetobacter sp. ANC 4945]|uniref:Uncharacterized protein n=1 Tax=Acinetobacter amyesii TaxID=2942470 RepID=A0A1T1GYA0_9GAMM|nr:hypothetical protein [Acinetobacter amyesii]MCL6246608.1 hypothetical protein [Acinetobacter amyesii]OOV82564.1 hypothetical protein B1202_08855 [Acinetobacter amyesii]
MVVPFHLSAKLLQLEPVLDQHWRSIVSEVCTDLDQSNLAQIQQVLLPKGIRWESSSQSYQLDVPMNLGMLMKVLKYDVMREHAQYLATQLEELRTLTMSIQVAQKLDENISYINKIDAEEDFELQHEKNVLHRHFILNAAQIIREMDLIVPSDARQLTAQQVKIFLIEIFLKSHVLGQVFDASIPKSSEVWQHPIFKYYLKREQKIRYLQIVQTSEFIYILSPDLDWTTQYSATRFLSTKHNDALADEVFDGAAIDLNTALENQQIEQLKIQVSKLASIAGFIHLDLQNLMQQLHIRVDKHLLLMLHVEDATQQLATVLPTFEQQFNALILKPLHQTVQYQLNEQIQHDFVFFHSMQISQKLITSLKVLSSCPKFEASLELKRLRLQLQAWQVLLLKRRAQIFHVQNEDDWGFHHQQSQQIYMALKALLQSVDDQQKIFATEATVENMGTHGAHVGFSKRMTKTGDYESLEADALKVQQQKKRQTYMQVLMLLKEHASQLVNLDFEPCENALNLQSFSDQRYFAISAGENGLNALPKILELSVNFFDFNLEKFAENLKN